VGAVEINPVRFGSKIDSGQSTYPLLDFIGLIGHEVTLSDGSVEDQAIKCTRNAAASIALACSESSYDQATLMLNRLAGFDLNVMTEFRVTDSVGAEFVRDVPEEIGPGRIEEMSKKFGGNILENRVNRMNNLDDKDEIIRKALADGPEGVLKSEYFGPTIKAMCIECDGTGVPGRRQELAGVKGKQSDGSAKTFEAKISAVFIIEYTAEGKPLLTDSGEIYRDKKTSYFGTVRKVEDFGPMLYQHAIDNGLEDMDAVIFLGDGGKWVWSICKTYFPYALTVLDLYHAIEHVNAMVDLLQFKGHSGSDKKQAFKDNCIGLLRRGEIQPMLDLVETLPCKKGNENKLETATSYFCNNSEHMNYGAFAACGLFVGTGVIEAGCKIIVGNRMKNSGMHWSKDHAEKMIALRCAIRNNEFFDSYLHDNSLHENSAA